MTYHFIAMCMRKQRPGHSNLDATLVPVPKQRNTEDEKAVVKDGTSTDVTVKTDVSAHLKLTDFGQS